MVHIPQAWEPAADIYETGDEIIVLVDLAGVKEDEIDLIVDKNILMIQGQRKEPRRASEMSYHRQEILWGPFGKGVPLPDAVNFSRIRATYEEGFLEIVLPKTREGAREIKVKTT